MKINHDNLIGVFIILLFSEITSPSDTYIEAGVATSLVCGVTGNDGTPSYVWYETGESTAVFTDTNNDATSTYNIGSPSESDTGSYYCVVTMTVDTVENGGFDSSEANLYVRGTNYLQY